MTWLPKKLVIVPYDFSDEAREAIDVALTMVESPENLCVVYVLQDINPLEMGEMWGRIDENMRREHALAALREKLADERYQRVRVEVLGGDASHAVTNFATEKQADLIVLPSHGRTGLRRMLIGSTSERIVRYAHCPVLVLRK